MPNAIVIIAIDLAMYCMNCTPNRIYFTQLCRSSLALHKSHINMCSAPFIYSPEGRATPVAPIVSRRPATGRDGVQIKIVDSLWVIE